MCGCGWLGCGGCVECGLLVGFRSFLRLRRALRRIRWVAQFGGVPGDALAAGGCSCARPRTGPSHCAHVRWAGGGRVWWAPESQRQGLRRRLRGERPRSGDGGPRCWAPDVACGRLCPGFPVTSSPGRKQTGPVVSSRITRCCGAASCDLTPPARSAWLRPPTRRGTRDNPGLWEGFPRLGHATSPSAGVRTRVDPVHTTGGVVPDPSSLSAVLAQPARTGGVKPDAARPQQRAMRLDTARPGWFPPGDVSDEGSGTRRPTHEPPPTRGVGDPSESRVPPPEAPALDFRHPPRPTIAAYATHAQ
ncbi:hypothetical protein ABH920_005109 [Catenulispora sp. EB89]